MINVSDAIELLFIKDNNIAYNVMLELQELSENSDVVYPFMDTFVDMLSSDNSYVRTRGLTLIAYNAKWDKDCVIDRIITKYLNHVTDIKPITSRQCIKLLPIIAKYKPALKNEIITALQTADLSAYADTMLPLILNDIKSALTKINQL